MEMKNAKLVVIATKMITFEYLYVEPEESGKDKNLYRLAKRRDWKDYDLNQVKFINKRRIKYY